MQNQEYMVGTDGCLVHTKTPLVEGWDKCLSLEQLMAHATAQLDASTERRVKWVGTKLPAETLQRVLGTIRQFPTREVGFTLQYRVSDGTWRVACPEQSGSGGSVHFKDEETTDGYATIGTIHTHPNMSAFWSGTDLQDQEGKFGLHIVFGLDDGIANRVLCTLFTPGGRYDHELDDLCEHVDRTQVYEPVQEWVAVINRQGYKTNPLPKLPSYTKPRCDYSVLGSKKKDYTLDNWHFPRGERTEVFDPDDVMELDEERLACCLYDLEGLITDVGLEVVLQTLRDLYPEVLIVDQEALKDKGDVVAAVEDCLLYLEDSNVPMHRAETSIAWTMACHGFLDTEVLDMKEDHMRMDLDDCEKLRKLNKYAEDFVSKWIAKHGIPKGAVKDKEGTDA